MLIKLRLNAIPSFFSFLYTQFNIRYCHVTGFRWKDNWDRKCDNLLLAVTIFSIKWLNLNAHLVCQFYLSLIFDFQLKRCIRNWWKFEGLSESSFYVKGWRVYNFNGLELWQVKMSNILILTNFAQHMQGLVLLVRFLV